MGLEDLTLRREEIHILTENDNPWACYHFSVPVPEKIHEFYKNENTYEEAKEAVIYSITQTVSKAISYELRQRIKYDSSILEETGKHSDFTIEELKLRLIYKHKVAKQDKEKTMAAKDKNNEEYTIYSFDIIESKWPQAMYIHNRLMRASEQSVKDFNSLKKALFKLAKKEKASFINQEGIEKRLYVRSRIVNDTGIVCFNLPGNGVGLHPDRTHLFQRDFSIDEKRFESLFGSKTTCYFPHNVDSFYEAIVLREFAINYINLLAKGME